MAKETGKRITAVCPLCGYKAVHSSLSVAVSLYRCGRCGRMNFAAELTPATPPPHDAPKELF